MIKPFYCFNLISGGLLAALCLAHADEAPAKDTPTPQQLEYFEAKVRPLLHEKCQPCHNDQAQLGGVRLDSLAAMFKGNSGGSVIVPGDIEKSTLVHVIRYDDKIKMPPSGKMKSEEIAILSEWVKMGTPWTNEKVSEAAKKAGKTGEYTITEAQRKFWSFQPVRKPVIPKVGLTKATGAKTSRTKTAKATKPVPQPANPIDAFVMAKLEAQKLRLSPQADRRTLIRRATFDLIGLPPTPEEVADFLNDKAPNAFANVVDRLLSSPRYGERWGRRWLDVARYADTKGYTFQEDSTYHNAYTYRDYVIRAFNEDLPYDRFIKEQLAADQLDLGDDKRPLAALGYLTLGRKFLNDYQLINDDKIDVTTRGLMGLTVSCARCHDHKFDPIPTADYYSLFGVFASSVETSPAISPKPIRDPYEAHQALADKHETERKNLLHAQINRLREMGKKDANSLSEEVKKILQSLREGDLPDAAKLAKLMPAFEPEPAKHYKWLVSEIETLKKTEPQKPEFATALKDGKDLYNPRIFKRGNDGNQGDAVPRRFLAILSNGERKPFVKGGGRLELAEAIVSPQNPLTPRVMVNRVWLYHFGAGLVRTPGDFGTRGEAPTHPELLDYLASRFMEEGWSIKKLHRLMMLSQTYAQSSTENRVAAAKDPENRLLYRQNRQRLDLEALRDSALWASGKLDLTMGGPSVPIVDAKYTPRRTVYGFIERQNLPGLFRTFDFASPDASSAQRFRTSVPQQALFMMNSPFLLDQAKGLASRPQLAKIPEGDPATRIKTAYQLLFQRAPDADEIALGKAFLTRPALSTATEKPAWSYGYGGIDEKTGRVSSFTPYAKFKDNRWQVSDQFPDSKLNYLLLTPEGGHPGSDALHATIRRWTSSKNLHLNLTGLIKHPAEQGDGVRVRVVSSRWGILVNTTAFHGEAKTDLADIDVRAGDTLDFVTDCRKDNSFDSFAWTVSLKGYSSGLKTVGNESTLVWSSQADFGGVVPPSSVMSSWERYTQALLMTNEFCFVD